MNLKEFRKREVTYDYLNNMFELFKADPDSEEFKVELLPFCNYITKDLYQKYPANTDNNYEEFFLDVVNVTLKCIKRRTPDMFENAKAFFVYLKKSVWLDARNLILNSRIKDSYSSDSISDAYLGYSERVPVDIRDTLNFELKIKNIKGVYWMFTKLYTPEEKKFLRSLFTKFQEGYDRDNKGKLISDYDEVNRETGILLNRLKILEKISKIIFKLSIMHFLNEDFSIKKFPLKKVENKEYFDKFFLILCSLDRYPYLMEMYSILGTEKFMEFIQVFGGTSLNIPRVSDIKKANQEVSSYIEFLDIPEEELKEISKKRKDVTLGQINATNLKITQKLKKILDDAYTE